MEPVVLVIWLGVPPPLVDCWGSHVLFAVHVKTSLDEGVIPESNEGVSRITNFPVYELSAPDW